MGLLDQFGDIAGSLMGDQQPGSTAGSSQSSTLLVQVVQMLGKGSSGGLAGLIQNFQKNGLGDIISSWVGTGQNQPISAEQLQAGLGSDTLQRLASQAGISPSEAGTHLSQMLPNLVDKLTPGGEMPESGTLEQVFAVLQSKLK